MFFDNALKAALSQQKLHLILLPTEKCNFRCTYCYEDFALGRMPLAVINGVKRLITNRIPVLSTFDLSWFGGEPLLAKDIMLNIGTYAHELCRRQGVGFSANTTTNGYGLTEELFSQLLDISHTEFQITLDGDEEWHDKTRVRANGGSTFAKIWENLHGCRRTEREFLITLRLHVHEDNVESMKRLHGRLKDEFLGDSRFVAYFHKVSNLGGPRPVSAKVLKRKEYLEALDYITDGRSRLSAPASGISEEHIEGYICYAARPNSLVIRANGRVGKCTVALQDERNDIGRINEDGTLDINNEKLRLWFEGYVELSPSALGCPATALRDWKGGSSQVSFISPSEIGRPKVDAVPESVVVV